MRIMLWNLLDVEANGRNSSHNLSQFELVEDGSFTSRVQTDHEDSHFLLAEKASESLGNSETHGVVFRLAWRMCASARASASSSSVSRRVCPRDPSAAVCPPLKGKGRSWEW